VGSPQLIDNALCGYRFAGLPRILAIGREGKTKDTRVPAAVVHETPVSALVDGGNNVGYVAVYPAKHCHLARRSTQMEPQHRRTRDGKRRRRRFWRT
jgi:hypothetical protein